jgi:hypothetical protein
MCEFTKETYHTLVIFVDLAVIKACKIIKRTTEMEKKPMH